MQVIAEVRRQIGADLKVILITGDTSSVVHAIQHDNRVRMANKPINADELLGLLRELLGI